MAESGYTRPRPNPISMAAAVGINGAIIAALITSAPQIFERPEKPFVAYPVVDPKPEPVEPNPEKAKVETRTAQTEALPDVPKPEVDTGATLTGPIFPIDPGPIDPPIPGGGAVTVDPVTPQPPVMVDAKLDPRYADDLQPPYPSSERRLEREGFATVRVLVGTDGRVKAVEPVRATSDAFLDATRGQALRRWRFKPATRDGVPVESWRTMTVRFVLE